MNPSSARAAAPVPRIPDARDHRLLLCWVGEPDLAAYLGLVSREDSSGPRERKGSITKAGNSHCRHVLVQAAWCYHYRPNLSAEIRRRQQGQPPAVVAHAWKAQQRLHQRYQHLACRKLPQIAVVAVARELVGFLWAVMRDLPTPEVAAA